MLRSLVGSEMCIRDSTWRKHARSLYQYSILLDTIWNTRTAAFLPYLVRNQNKNMNIATQTLLTGTHRPNEEQNYLQLIDLTLPTTSQFLDGLYIDPDSCDIGGYGSATSQFGASVHRRMYHDGGVMGAQYMPGNPLLIASNSTNTNTYIFDWSTISHTKEPNDLVRPTCPYPPHALADGATDEQKQRYHKRMQEIRNAHKEQKKWDQRKGKGQHSLALNGNNDIAYSLSWSPVKDGYLAAGSTGRVAVWDISQTSRDAPRVVEPTLKFEFGSPINDSKFSHCSPFMLWVTLANGSVARCDLRDPSSKVLMHMDNTAPISLALSPINDHAVAVGGEDGCLYIYDERAMGNAVMSPRLHDGDVGTIDWSPFRDGAIVTGGQDGFCSVYDVVSNKQVFRHAAHVTPVTDVRWCGQDAYAGMISSCDSETITVWKPRDVFWEDVASK
eukprot:TRINITY_DN7497_c0_g2_i1.p1 TRINITY_DN7497_c0_g2~~TRINITY_DN7497_c0_g2_i1.p1  ORF type:complete len:444 (+),score=67.80 TRINITY_DN7497_c0_g2_i1:177-1508(+)